MPIAKCNKCGNNQFTFEDRRVFVTAGDLHLSGRAGCQVCTKCGNPSVDYQVIVEPKQNDSMPDTTDKPNKRPTKNPSKSKSKGKSSKK